MRLRTLQPLLTRIDPFPDCELTSSSSFPLPHTGRHEFPTANVPAARVSPRQERGVHAVRATPQGSAGEARVAWHRCRSSLPRQCRALPAARVRTVARGAGESDPRSPESVPYLAGALLPSPALRPLEGVACPGARSECARARTPARAAFPVPRCRFRPFCASPNPRVERRAEGHATPSPAARSPYFALTLPRARAQPTTIVAYGTDPTGKYTRNTAGGVPGSGVAVGCAVAGGVSSATGTQSLPSGVNMAPSSWYAVITSPPSAMSR